MERKDYYSILGISDEEKKLKGKEFEKIAKDKFRKLSKIWHPDKCKDENKKAEYESKFKDIAEAYEVLSKEDKRAAYDNPSANFQFNGFGDSDIEDILRGMGMGGFNPFGFDMFGGFGGMGGSSHTNKPQAKIGRQIEAVLELTLEEMYSGVSKNIKIQRQNKCTHCNGSGSEDGRIVMCDECSGTGQVFRTISKFGMTMQNFSTCRKCGGKGEIPRKPCKYCGGSGLVTETEEVKVDVPKGVEDENVLQIQNMGSLPNNPKDGDVRGRLIVILHEKKHDKYIRNESDLLYKIKLNLIDSLLGATVNIPTIDGKMISTKISGGTESGTKLRFVGKGMPIYGTNKYGNMIGVVSIELPKKLNDREKELIEELSKQEHFKKD